MNENTLMILKLIPLESCMTIYMVLASCFFAVIFGAPLGILLYLTDEGGLLNNSKIYKPLSALVDVIRSFPFAILLLALIPLTRVIVGTSLGTNAAIVPLSIAAAPYFARLLEFSLKSVSRELIEASLIMGSTPLQIVNKVALRESLPRILIDITNTLINLTGYSAMAGLVGGGGLGKVAIDYGYYRFNTPIMIITVFILILIVQTFQRIGSQLSKKILSKRGLIAHE